MNTLLKDLLWLVYLHLCAACDKPLAEGEIAPPAPPPPPPPPPMPETYTVGVTDYTFNPINAIFGRLLRTKDGHIVSLAYWQQKESVSNDEVPYFGNASG